VRAISAAVILVSTLALGAGLSACENNSAFTGPRIISDTVTIAIPSETSTLASAIDLARLVPPFAFERFPERLTDAQQWDFALRRAAGTLILRPFTVVGGGLRGAGIATSATEYERIRRAPRSTTAYGYEPITLTAGTTYVARSRQFSAGAGIPCVKYGKLKVLDLDAALGTATLAVTVNDVCDDDRLTE
jgi:hypothetical protein